MIILSGPSKMKIYRVECGRCGTVFECIENEFKTVNTYSQYSKSPTDLHIVDCPFCHLTVVHPLDHYKFQKDSCWQLNKGEGPPYGTKIEEISYEDSYIKNKFIDEVKNYKTESTETL